MPLSDCAVEAHVEHCEMCGAGILIDEDHNLLGWPVYAEYDEETIQDVAYPELDHVRCDTCAKRKEFPKFCTDWTPEIREAMRKLTPSNVESPCRPATAEEKRKWKEFMDREFSKRVKTQKPCDE